MKNKIISVCLFLMLLYVVPSIYAGKNQGKARISFVENNYNFGNIKEKKGAVTHVFEFSNTGDGNLLILDANASCGCTRPDYPKEPIAPGKKGKIKVTFLPQGRPGSFDKSVTVRTNGTPKKITLRIKGNVLQ